ncbi:MAG: MFS transporter [Prochloraceae cyanobacterium]
MPPRKLFQLPNLKIQVWILAAGRLLSQIGTGFTLFYAPIFFVDTVGLSATEVGFGLGTSASLSGVLGRFLGGNLTDSASFGRKKTLLLSAAISAVADIFLALADNFPIFIIGNLLMGLGIGLYWPATEAAVVDLTTVEQRNEAFAITRLADTIGLGLGVVLGGAWIANLGNYRGLFVVDGISFIIFFLVIYLAISETYQFLEEDREIQISKAWITALSDRRLLIFLLVNILFTTYISQTQTTMPLYFKKFVSTAEFENGFPPGIISIIYSWHIVFAAICQLPVARFLNRFTRARSLIISMLLWGIGFIFIWVTGVADKYALFWAFFALGILGIAMVAYTPSASAIVADLAPPSLRGFYLGLNSQCWAIGYFIGPPLGGYSLDRSSDFADLFWLAAAASIIIGIIILLYLDRLIIKSATRRQNR